MKGFIDHYKVLGIERDATLEEIKKAYRELAHQFHPDKSKDESSQARFLEINRAYEVLKEPSSRGRYNNIYDRRLREGNSDYYASLQRTRAKRSSRYSRSQYSQRMRYRGQASKSNENQPFTYTEPKSRHRSFYQYSNRYAEQVIADYEYSMKVYKRVTFALRVLIVGIMGICLGLLIDKWTAQKGDFLEITKIQELRDAIGINHGIKVSTEGAVFYVDPSFEMLLLREKQVRIARTPFRNIISGVYVKDGEEERKVKLKREAFDFGFYAIWLIIFGGGLCLYFRQNPEMNFKLCVGTLLLALFIYFSVFHF